MGSVEELKVRVVKMMEKVAKSLGVIFTSSTKKDGDDASVLLALIKDQLYSAWLGLKGERLKRAAVSLLGSLASLALEDNRLVGHWGNCLAYLDAGLTALKALGGSNYLLSLEHLSKTRVSLRSRKSNMNNQARPGDERNNFLNRLDQAQQELSGLRETLLFALSRGAATFDQTRALPGLYPAGLVLTDELEVEEEEDEDYDYEEETSGLLASLLLNRPRSQGR